MPPIKKLVLSGACTMGIQFIGILKKLEEDNYWSKEDIQKIYATSSGTMIAVLIALKYDWETIYDYIINRPWENVFYTSESVFDIIMNIYTNKGIYDNQLIVQIFKSLLEAKEISINVTLKEFYNLTQIELYFYAFQLNEYKTLEISYHDFPDMTLIDAITCSSSLPFIFKPYFHPTLGCILDGGILCNYPLKQCLNECGKNECGKNECGKNECDGENNVLGIKVNVSKMHEVLNTSSLIDFIYALFMNTISYLSKYDINDIPNTIIAKTTNNMSIWDVVKGSITSSNYRRHLILEGEQIATTFNK